MSPTSPAVGSHRQAYGRSPCYPELAAVAVAGLIHILLEIAAQEAVALWFSAGAALAFLAYLVWRTMGDVGVLRWWGMRQDNFWPALRAQAVLGAAGASALLIYAAVKGQMALPPGGFWLTLGLYPIWGVSQQFALQNLVARNVAGLVRRPVAVAGVTAVLFAVSHVPRWPLVTLTLVGGFFFTMIYRRVPNLWAVGLVHGVLGSLAIYLVSGEDPGAEIWKHVAGLWVRT